MQFSFPRAQIHIQGVQSRDPQPAGTWRRPSRVLFGDPRLGAQQTRLLVLGVPLCALGVSSWIVAIWWRDRAPLPAPDQSQGLPLSGGFRGHPPPPASSRCSCARKSFPPPTFAPTGLPQRNRRGRSFPTNQPLNNFP